MDAKTFANVAAIQFNYTAWVVGANLKDITDEQSLENTTAGSNLNWVAGHIAQARGSALQMLGQACPYPTNKYDRYERGMPNITNADEAVPLSEIVADFNSTAEALKAGLAGLTAEALAAKAPFSPSGNREETVGSLMAGLVFHEAYHAGQLGVLRRQAGGEGVIK